METQHAASSAKSESPSEAEIPQQLFQPGNPSSGAAPYLGNSCCSSLNLLYFKQVVSVCLGFGEILISKEASPSLFGYSLEGPLSPGRFGGTEDTSAAETKGMGYFEGT